MPLCGLQRPRPLRPSGGDKSEKFLVKKRASRAKNAQIRGLDEERGRSLLHAAESLEKPILHYHARLQRRVSEIPAIYRRQPAAEGVVLDVSDE